MAQTNLENPISYQMETADTLTLQTEFIISFNHTMSTANRIYAIDKTDSKACRLYGNHAFCYAFRLTLESYGLGVVIAPFWAVVLLFQAST